MTQSREKRGASGSTAAKPATTVESATQKPSKPAPSRARGGSKRPATPKGAVTTRPTATGPGAVGAHVPVQPKHALAAESEGRNTSVKLDGTVLAFDLDDVIEGLGVVAGTAKRTNYVHVNFEDWGSGKNLTELARTEPKAYEAVVGLAANEYYMYKHEAGRSSFVSRRNLPTLWQPVREGRIHESAQGILYQVEEAPAPTGRPKLLVIFSAMADRIYSPSLYRYMARNFKTIQKYVSPSTHVMRIADVGGVVGNFYLDSGVLPKNASNVQRTIKSVMTSLGAVPSDVVLLGASKGATAATYHGLSMGLKHVAVDPVLHEGEYWDRFNDSHFTRNQIFPRTKQEVFAELMGRLRDRGRLGTALDKQVVITSERSPQFHYIEPALLAGNDRNVVLINDNPGILDHPDVPVFSQHITTSTVDQLLAGVKVAAGTYRVD